MFCMNRVHIKASNTRILRVKGERERASRIFLACALLEQRLVILGVVLIDFDNFILSLYYKDWLPIIYSESGLKLSLGCRLRVSSYLGWVNLSVLSFTGEPRKKHQYC